MVYDKNIEEIRNNYEHLSKDIHDMGSRPKDMILLNQVDTLQLVRVNSGIKFSNLNSELIVNSEWFYEYLELMKRYSVTLKAENETTELTNRTIQFLTRYENKPTELNLLNFLINLTTAENLIIDRYRWLVGDGHGFYTINFNIHSNKDTLSVNTPYKMMISLKPDVTEEYWNIEIDSLSLTRDEIEINDSYKFEKIGGVGYFEYHPIVRGVYKFKGSYKMIYKREEFVLQESFIKQFIVE